MHLFSDSVVKPFKHQNSELSILQLKKLYKHVKRPVKTRLKHPWLREKLYILQFLLAEKRIKFNSVPQSIIAAHLFDHFLLRHRVLK